MKKRLITGLIIAVIFTPIFLIKALNPVFELCMIFLSIFGSYEMLKMYDENHQVNKFYQILLLTIPIFLFYGIISLFNNETFLLNNLNKDFFIGLFLLLFVVLLSMMVFINDFNGKKISEAIISIIYPTIGFTSIFLLKYKGTEYLVYLFIISIFTDVFAYFVGVKFGKHKLCPNISPKKSIEGSIGGIIFAVIFSFLFAYFYDGGLFFIFENSFLNAIAIIFLGIVLSICSQIGDLVASKFKRTYDIKDFSNLFPGHGGVLDRFDSVIFLAMVLCLIVVVI